MSVKLNKTGKYEIQFSQGGRRVHRVLPEGTTRAEAKRKETELRREVFRADELDELPDYTIGEGIMRYLREYTGKAKKQTESHAKALELFVKGRAFSDYLDVVQRVLSEKSPVTHSTRNRRLSVLRRVAHLAYRRWGWLKEPLHEKIELLPENPARQIYLTRPELAQMLWKIKVRSRRKAAYMLLYSGLRKGELKALEPDDFTGTMVTLRDSKTGTPRNVPIIVKARWAFRTLPIRVDWSGLSKDVKTATKGKARVHDIRHTTASLLINAGVPLYTVGAILGHRSLQTTKRYAHLETKTLEQAMNQLQTTRQLPAPPEKTGDKAA